MIVKKYEVRSIVASNSGELAQKISEHGHAPESVFLKVKDIPVGHEFLGPIERRNRLTVDDFSPLFIAQFGIHGRLVPTTKFEVEKGQLELLAKLHEVLPNNVAAPIAHILTPFGGEILEVAWAIEHVDGRTLFSHIEETVKEQDLHKMAVLSDLVREIGRLIDRLHEYGIAHGDPHSANILITADGRPVFVDPRVKAIDDRLSVFEEDKNCLRSIQEDIRQESRLLQELVRNRT